MHETVLKYSKISILCLLLINIYKIKFKNFELVKQVIKIVKSLQVMTSLKTLYKTQTLTHTFI